MDFPSRSRLVYVDADELDTSLVDFDGLEVRSSTGEEIGHVDGFLVDLNARRPYYVVVDSGGWFKSRQFLLPIGHARLADGHDAVLADVARRHLEAYPEYDRAAFATWSEDDVRRFEQRTAAACCPEESRVAPGTPSPWSHHQAPAWWRDDLYAGRAAGGPVAGDPSPHVDGRAQPGDVIGIETAGERTALGEDAEDENARREAAERENAKLAAGNRTRRP